MPLWSLWGSPAKLSLLPLRFELPSLRIILIVVVEIASWEHLLRAVCFSQSSSLSPGINLLRCHWPHFTDGETWVTEAAGSQVGNRNKNFLPWPRAVFLLEDPYYLHHDGQTLLFCSLLWPQHLEHYQIMCAHVLMCILWADHSVSLSGDSLYKPPSSTLTLLCQTHSRNFITRTEFNFRVTWTHGWETKFWNSWATHPG